jgi:hypothetical protein
MRRCSSSVLVLAAAMLVVSCARNTREAAEHPSTSSLSVVPSSSRRTSVSTQSRGPTVAPPTFSLSDAGLVLLTVPQGFAPWGKPVHLIGPLAGVTHDAQQFRNTSSGQAFVVSVTRNVPPRVAMTDGDGRPRLVAANRAIRGLATYVPAPASSTPAWREFDWRVSPTTWAAITGYHLSDVTLLGIANTLEVAP